MIHMESQGLENRYPGREEKKVRLGEVAGDVHDQVKDLPICPPPLGNFKTPGLTLPTVVHFLLELKEMSSLFTLSQHKHR